MDEADHDFPMDRVLSAFLISGVTHMRVFAMWPGPSKQDPSAEGAGGHVNHDNWFMGWGTRKAGYQDNTHEDVYAFSSANCRVPGNGCTYDLNTLNENWKERMEKIVNTAEKYHITPCLVVFDTAWFHSAIDVSHHPWSKNNILSSSDKLLDRMKQVARWGYEAGFRCFEAANEPLDYGTTRSIIIEAVQKFNRWVKQKLSGSLVIADDTHAPPCSCVDGKSCYEPALASDADYFMLHSAGFNPGRPQSAREIRACYDLLPSHLQSRTIISDDGNRQNSYEPNYFNFYVETYYHDNFVPEFHFHKMSKPTIQSSFKTEAWVNTYWRDIINIWLPQWKLPSGLNSFQQAIRYCRSAKRWDDCLTGMDKIRVKPDEPFYLFWNSSFSKTSCRVTHTTPSGAVHVLAQNTRAEKTYKAIQLDSIGDHTYTISCQPSDGTKAKLTVSVTQQGCNDIQGCQRDDGETWFNCIDCAVVDIWVNGEEDTLMVEPGTSYTISWEMKAPDSATCQVIKQDVVNGQEIIFVYSPSRPIGQQDDFISRKIDECTTDSDCPSTRCILEPVYMEFRYTATCVEGAIDRYNEVTVISQYDRKVCEKPR